MEKCIASLFSHPQRKYEKEDDEIVHNTMIKNTYTIKLKEGVIKKGEL